jgi:hypothetical protein
MRLSLVFGKGNRVAVPLPSVSQRIQGFLRAARPNAYCTVCLAKSLGFSLLYEGKPEAIARDAVAGLAPATVTRATAVCTLCGKRTLVISARA